MNILKLCNVKGRLVEEHPWFDGCGSTKTVGHGWTMACGERYGGLTNQHTFVLTAQENF